MTSRKITLGAITSAIVLLAACSSEEPKSEQSPEQPEVVIPDAAECTDPLKDNPTEVNARELIACATQTLASTEGFVSRTTLDGELLSEMRLNPDPFIIDISYPDGTTIIADPTEAWVKPGGKDWVKADPASEDYVISQATQIANTYMSQLDPALAAAGLPDDLMLKVTGHEEIDGMDCFVIEGQLRQDTSAQDATYWMTADYKQVKTHIESAATGQDGTMVMENHITEWDKKQDIQLPR